MIKRDEGVWSLPNWRGQPILWQRADLVNCMAREHFGLPTTVLRPVRVRYGESLSLIYELELHNPLTGLLANAEWIERGQLAGLVLSPPEQRPVIDAVLAEYDRDIVPEKRAPWARRGWFAECVSWIESQLRHLDGATTGPVEQFHSRERGFVARVPTTAGLVYFKACPTFFPQEVPVTAVLAERYPMHLPQILALDRTKRWLLLREFPGRLLDAVDDPLRWVQALGTYAEIQVECANQINELLALGCPNRQLQVLKEQIDLLVENLAELQIGRFALCDRELEDLRELLPLLRIACDKLASYGIPPSIEHGDLAAFNMAVDKDNTFVFDWSEASVTHPFLGLWAFFSRIDGFGVDLTELKEKHQNCLREAYLKPWRVFETPERLTEAFELSMPLSALHYALTCKLFVLPHLEAEARWQEANMLVYYMRGVLSYRDKLHVIVCKQ